MGWLHAIVVTAAGLGSMRAAIERGDIDEAARQGMLAGPAVIEEALAADDRPARLAAIAAAPSAPGRAELLEALARTAGGPDRRTALPAARAARTIARELATAELPDDLAPADVAAWRDAWGELATRADRWIELRVIALDVASTLDQCIGEGGSGIPLDVALADPDPAFRRAAVAGVPAPVPIAMRAQLVAAIVKDLDPDVALAAAQILCFDVTPATGPAIAQALGDAGMQRIKALVTGSGSKLAIRDARRCLAIKR